jgi:RIO kinase 1
VRAPRSFRPFILYWQGSLTIIDMPQTVDPRFNPGASALLERDIENVCAYFASYGVHANPSRIARSRWARFARGMLTPPGVCIHR